MRVSASYILVLITMLFVSGCATHGGKFEPATVYKNMAVPTEKPIALNVENYISLPPAYMSAVRNTIRTEFKKENKTMKMGSISELDMDYKAYVVAAREDLEGVTSSGSYRSAVYSILRRFERSYTSGFEMMVADGKSFEKQDLAVIVNYRNTTKMKNVPLAFLSAITVFAVPLVKEHTLTVEATYYYKDQKIGDFKESVDYDFTYGWGVNKENNLHIDQVKNLTKAVIQNMGALSYSRADEEQK